MRAVEASKSRSSEVTKAKTVRVSMDQPVEKMLKNNDEMPNDKKPGVAQRNESPIGPQDCTEMDVQTFHVTLTYKPRI